jgi:DNA-binding GntR family transcriptional regulator
VSEPKPRQPIRPAERIASDLRARITSGELAPGEQLPTVAQLTKTYGVAKVTALKALGMLRSEGLIYTEARWGSFVSDRSGGKNLTELSRQNLTLSRMRAVRCFSPGQRVG